MRLSTLLGLGLLVAVQCAKTNYNKEEARTMFIMSAGAYGNKANQEKCIANGLPSAEGWKLYSSNIRLCDNLKCDCADFIVVSEKKKEMIVAFRGTNEIGQLKTETTQSDIPKYQFHDYGLVNGYFGEAHARLWPDVEKALKEPKYKDYRVLFTGHSLGGALAVLAAAHVESAGLRSGSKIKVITFGEPRVGGYDFAQKFDKKIPESYRVVNQQDAIPHVGPCQKREVNSGLLGWAKALPGVRRFYPCIKGGDGFFHHGYEIWYNTAGMKSYVECERGEDFACSEGHIGSHILNAGYKLDDHTHYFEQSVSGFGLNNCEGQTEKCKLSCPLQTLKGALSNFFG